MYGDGTLLSGAIDLEPAEVKRRSKVDSFKPGLPSFIQNVAQIKGRKKCGLLSFIQGRLSFMLDGLIFPRPLGIEPPGFGGNNLFRLLYTYLDFNTSSCNARAAILPTTTGLEPLQA